MSVLISSSEDMTSRQQQLAQEDEINLNETKKSRKNSGFTQIYPQGWIKAVYLAKKDAKAFELYAFFAQHLDPSCGAVVCDQKFLANQLEVSTRTIQRKLDFLESEKSLVRIPIAGKVCAYALNPEEVWKGYKTSKDYAVFRSKTMVKNDLEISRKLKAMFSK